jgi:hypothetical protein
MIRNTLLYILVCLLAACKQKPGTTSGQEPTAFSGAEEVTAAVSALLPSPHSFQLKQAKKWHDTSGENWLVLYETGSYIPKLHTAASARLSAILYLKTDSGFVEKWRHTDGIADCTQDVICAFYENQLSVTDLDSNGLAEVTLVYALGCKGTDVVPEKMLVLLEANRKYTLKGTVPSLVHSDSTQGIITHDTAFAAAPAVFRSFARDYWSRFGRGK